MSLADDLWEKHWNALNENGHALISRQKFLAAIKEYGEAVRKRDAELCMEHATIEGIAQKCAAAIEREPLP